MKFNLGRKVLLLFFIPIVLFAKVSLEAPKSFVQGNFVVFEIIVSGENIEIPKITKIEEYPVQLIGNSKESSTINGRLFQRHVQRFAFKPENEIVIPPFEIKIDGQVEKTEPKKIVMLKRTKTVSDLFDYDIKVDKTNSYVGESIALSVILKYRKDINVSHLEFEKINFNNFWVKKIQKSPIKINKDSNFNYEIFQYLLFPQQEGKYEFGALKVGIVTLEGNSFFFSGATNKHVLYSNSVTINVQKLPANVYLIGDFTLETSVDKLSVKQGEAISYKINIKGVGNVDDIPEFKLDIPSATIYENPAKKEYSYNDGKYGGEFTKVYSIVPSGDFIIPSITLKYFDKESGEVKTLQSKEYPIKVEGAVKKEVELETASKEESKSQLVTTNTDKTIQTPINTYEKITYFLLGIGTIIGLILFIKLVQTLQKKKTKKELPLHSRINKAESKKELLQIMAIYINIDKDLDKIIYTIETQDDPKTLNALKKEAIKLMKTKNIKGLS